LRKVARLEEAAAAFDRAASLDAKACHASDTRPSSVRTSDVSADPHTAFMPPDICTNTPATITTTNAVSKQ
jgi:hypothetical protein